MNEFLEEKLSEILESVIQRQQSLVYERSHEMNPELEVMIRRAFDRFMTDPEAVLSNMAFRQTFGLLSHFFFLSNLPCSDRTFQTL